MTLFKVTALADIQVTANVITPQRGEPLRGIPPFTQGEKTFHMSKGEVREDISLVHHVRWHAETAPVPVPHPSVPGKTNGIDKLIRLEKLS